MDYGDGTMTQAVNIEKLFAEFFHNIKAALRRLQVNLQETALSNCIVFALRLHCVAPGSGQRPGPADGGGRAESA